jgi:xanthine/uracil permease
MLDVEKPQPSLGELFTELARDTSTLVRQEVQLAKTEMTAKAKTASKDFGIALAGGVLAHAGMLAVLAAAVLGLARIIDLWAAALIVGVVAMVVGYVLVQRGMAMLKRLDPVPRETVRSLEAHKEWVKEQAR